MTVKINSLEELKEWANGKDIYDLGAYRWSNQSKGTGPYTANIGTIVHSIQMDTNHGYGLKNGVFVEILY